MKRELLFNLITNIVLDGELYFLVHNLTSAAHEERILLLRHFVGDKGFLENCLTMEKL